MAALLQGWMRRRRRGSCWRRIWRNALRMLKRSACLKCFQIVKGTGKVTCSGSTMHRWLWQKPTASFTHGIKHIFASQSDRATQDVHRQSHFICSDDQGCILTSSSTDVNAKVMHVQDCQQRSSPVQPATRQIRASCQPNAAHSGLRVEFLSFFFLLADSKALGKCCLWACEGLSSSLLEPSAWLLY